MGFINVIWRLCHEKAYMALEDGSQYLKWNNTYSGLTLCSRSMVLSSTLLPQESFRLQVFTILVPFL